ncbi:calcium uptake protein 3, mitochondrial-like [Notothenia coriiceps]|uniref:Calcium uptake protein 3, mitochondrial-like n=1 Tax=Notothenia coriiceps TaxID=8208 RepID=A0A6I9NWY7_9TELE|nr:PREDICTED: calcium uptake protein 3, mitochondrial-like [Notothenia coriiceps]
MLATLSRNLGALGPAAKQARPFDFEEGDVYMSSHEHRFRMFSSVEYDGQLYMTPQNFIESVTMSEPKNKRPWRSLAKQELEKILVETPPVWRGSSKLFRNLREQGVSNPGLKPCCPSLQPNNLLKNLKINILSFSPLVLFSSLNMETE